MITDTATRPADPSTGDPSTGDPSTGDLSTGDLSTGDLSTGATMTDIPLVEMVLPMPGFPALREFALVQLDECGMACDLRALAESGPRFLVVPPAEFFPSYAPELDDDTVARLEITSADDILVLVVVRPGASLAQSTANLRAPIVVNTANRLAQQVVLDDADLSLTTPLLAG